MQPDDRKSAKELLYYYSSYQKDLQEAKQAEESRKAQRRRVNKKHSIPMSRK